MSRLVHPELSEVSLSALLHALSNPTRRAIVRALARDKACGGTGLSCSAATPPDAPKATMSNHYAILRAAGLLRGEPRGVEVLHSLRCAEVEARFPGVLAAILAADERG